MARKIKLRINTGYPSAYHEDYADLPEGWDDMTEEQRVMELDELAETFLYNYIDVSAKVVEVDE